MKQLSKCLLLGLCVIIPWRSVQTNPIAIKFFSELQLEGETRMGWSIELVVMWSEDSTMDGWYLTTSNDTSMLDSGIALGEGAFIILDAGSLHTPLSLSASGEIVTLFNSSGQWMDELRYGDVENTETPSPPEGYSICLDYDLSHYWYLDSSPTLGSENDTDGAMCTIEGYVYNEAGNPFEGVDVRHAMTTHEMDSVYVTTDASGFYTIERKARSLYLQISTTGYQEADTAFQTWPNTTHQVDFQLRTLVGIDDREVHIPEQFELMQNYPNPFNASTSIQFGLPTSSQVRIDVLKLDGSHVANVLDKTMSPGNHTLSWDAANLSSGIYVYTMKAGDINITRKMILLK